LPSAGRSSNIAAWQQALCEVTDQIGKLRKASEVQSDPAMHSVATMFHFVVAADKRRLGLVIFLLSRQATGQQGLGVEHGPTVGPLRPVDYECRAQGPP
jgi:hypothetical protein